MSENDQESMRIIRKDARNCFVESLNDAFPIGKAHLCFSSYDLGKPTGQRQTDYINIYLAVDEVLELCRKLYSGELRYLVQSKKKNADSAPIYQSLGGTSAEKLAKLDRSRADGKSLSRTMQVCVGNKSDFLLIAESGPGEENERGLIVPKFGGKPEQHVAVSMQFETLSELLLTTKAHYEAWLHSLYFQKFFSKSKNKEHE